MKTTTFTLALAIAAANGALAQGFESARIGIDGFKYDDGDGFDISYLSELLDLSHRFGGGFGVQLGLAHSDDVGSSDPFVDDDPVSSLTLHGFYDLSTSTRLGLMLGKDSYNDGDTVLAAEAIHLAGPARIEARLGRFDSAVEPATLMELRGEYRLAQGFSLLGGYQRITYDGGFGYFSHAYLGGAYDIGNRARIHATYGATVNDYGVPPVYEGSQITVGFTADLGGPRNPKMFTYNPFF